MVAFFVAVLRPAPAAAPAAPRPAGPAVLLALARVLQPRRDLHVGAARLSGAGLPARAHADGSAAGRRAAARRGVPFTAGARSAFLALALIFLVGFRVGLNLTNSNVIDVGYSGVIGADRLTHGEDLYGTFPDDNALRRHVRAGQLLRVRAVRAGVSVVGHVGRPAGRARGGACFDLATMLGAVLRRPAAARRAGRQPARARARLRMGRLSRTRCSCSTRMRTTPWSRCW